METKLYVVIFLFLFLTVAVPFGMVLCQGQLEWSTTYRIKAYADGSATWIIERRALLKTEDDVTIFFHYSSMEYMQEFSNNISSLVNRAWLKTGREDMKAENFKITASLSNTTTGTRGEIKYQFDWLKFANVSTRISIGDVFVNGVFLFGDGTLIIECPLEYLVVDVSPRPDAPDTLTWYGLENLEEGEPRVILEERTLSTKGFLQEYGLVIVGVVVVAGIGSAGLWFFRFRKRERIEVSGLVPKVPLGIENDEEKVVALLRAAGGRLYQSIITKQFGFSKSKTSGLLKNMERKGIVRREKRGREKLVTLTDTNDKKRANDG